MRACLSSLALLVGAFVVAYSAPGVRGEEPPKPALFRSVSLVPQDRTVVATGWINQVSGPIELLGCGPGGKTHESVLVLNVNPVDLQAALIALGLEPGEPLEDLGTGPPVGTGIEIWVDWQEEAQDHSVRAEQLVRNVETESVLPETQWIFTGSVFKNGEFKALAEESLIATFWDPWAIFNVALAVGSNDEALVVNEAVAPALGTPVEVRFKIPDEVPSS